MDNIEIHGIKFIRYGFCKRCGACEKPNCPHFKLINELATCLTYGRGDYLKWNCDKFPDNPFCKVIFEEICGYTFEPVTEADLERYLHCLKTWGHGIPSKYK
jgi:hypothetical protein